MDQFVLLLAANVKKNSFVLFSLLLLTVSSSSAMSLGQHQGVALIGRPLNISVRATLDPKEDPENLCFEADIYYADNKLDKSRVRVRLEKTIAQNTVIHISTNVVVDEPVVTLSLRTGCLQKFERRYVILADLVSEVINQSALPSLSGGVGSFPGRLNPLNATIKSALPSDGATSTNKRLLINAPLTSPASGSKSMAAGVQSALAPGIQDSTALFAQRKGPLLSKTTNSSSRLKLEPIDLSIERNPMLKLSAELLSVPATNLQDRSASAVLWRSLTALPPDILRDAGKLQASENAVRDLQVQAIKNQKTIDGLNEQVKTVQSAERYFNVAVYTAGVLLLITIAALVYLLRRRSELHNKGSGDMPWWRRKEPLEQKGWANNDFDANMSSLADESEVPQTSLKKNNKSQPAMLSVDLDIGSNVSKFTKGEPTSSLAETDSALLLSRKDCPDFSLSMTHPTRAVKAEELIDVQQQADFFVSLGQHEHAIDLLRNHISENVQTSALIYLDLFKLYHQLKHEAEYELLRVEFNQHFNGRIPSFDFYTDFSPGLEIYQTALARIEALWPSPKVLEVIEESIFKKPDANTEAFNLEAYRELLLLYAVAKEIISPEISGRGELLNLNIEDFGPGAKDANSSKFQATPIQPLSAIVAGDKERESQMLQALVVLPPLPRLNPDIDITRLVSQSVGLTSKPESDSQFFAQFSASTIEDHAVASLVLTTELPQVKGAGNFLDFDPFEPAVEANDKLNRPVF